MTPEDRFENAWRFLPLRVKIYFLAKIHIPQFAGWAREALMRAKARTIFITSVIGFIALFWIFADMVPGRVLLLAGVAWGAITIAALLAVYLPWDNGKNDPPK